MKKKRNKPVSWDSADIIAMAHNDLDDAASRLLAIIDDTTGPDVGAVVALMAMDKAHLFVGRVHNGKLRVRSTDEFKRQLGGSFEVELCWDELEIAFTHFCFPDHWNLGGMSTGY
jgi:hypothetical protein